MWTPFTDLAGMFFIIIFGVFGFALLKKLCEPAIKQSEVEKKCYVVEEAVIEGIAKKKGYNIAELEARNAIQKEKTFLKMMKEKAIEEFFGKDKQ